MNSKCEERGIHIVQLERVVNSPNFLVFVQGSWEVADNQRNLRASQMIADEMLASTLLYESPRNRLSLQKATTNEDWQAAFNGRNYLDELESLLAAINHLKNEYRPQKIFLSGSSYGGGLVTLVLGIRRDIDGVLLHAPQIIASEELKRINIYQEMPAPERYLEAIAGFSGKVRMIHGDKDRVIPLQHSLTLYSHVQTTDRKLILLPGNHTFTDNLAGYAQEHVELLR